MGFEIDPAFALGYDRLFDSAWLKWFHGVGHAQALEADIDAFSFNGSSDPLLAARAEYHPKRHGFGVYPVEIAPTPLQWGLMLGDVANNYRCALDHIAWALVQRGRTPPSRLTNWQAKGVYFPISETRQEFNAEIRRPLSKKDRPKLAGVRRADSAKVRRRQPYHYRSERKRASHFLTVLAALNNADKHRTLQPIWVYPTRVNIEITRMEDCVVPKLGWPRRRGPLQVDTEFAFIRARKLGPKPHLEVKTHVTAEPSIENHIGVKTWIAQCGAFTALLLRELSEPPQEIVNFDDPLIADRWAWFGDRAQRAYPP